MNPRRLGLLVLIAALGVGAGYGVAALAEDDTPQGIDTAAPVVASKPSVPSTPKVKVLDDPDTPALAVNQPTHLERIGPKAFPVKVPVPDDWLRNNSSSGEWKWTEPGQPVYNTFFLRVRLVSNTFEAVPAALARRIAALRGAESVADFEIDSQSKDTIEVTYVSSGYRRVAMETFLSTDSDDLVDVSVAVIGRERDRLGLRDLLTQVATGITTG